MNGAPNPFRCLALEPILGGIFRVFEIGAYRLTDSGRLYPRSAIFAYHFAAPRNPHALHKKEVQAVFRSRTCLWSADTGFECCTEWKDKHEGQNMPLQMPHVSVCDSHNSLPQSKHCVLAVPEQGKPSASAEFLISMTSQFWHRILRFQFRSGTRQITQMPAWNRLTVALSFKQFFTPVLLRIFPIENLEPSAVLALPDVRPELLLGNDA